MRHAILMILLITMFSVGCFGQEGIYYYGINSKPVERLNEAVSYKEVKKKSEKKYIIKTHLKKDGKWEQVKKEKIKAQGNGSQTIHCSSDGLFPGKIYRDLDKVSPLEYHFRESNLSGVIRTGISTRFMPLHLDGMVTEYHPNGETKSKSIYRNNQLISNENWLSDGTKYIDSIFYSVDEEPEYQMGDAFFKSYLLKKIGGSDIDITQIEDLVVIGWVVMESGSIDGAIALKGKSRQLNEFLVNTIIELPGYWTPAILDGKPVRYFMSIPLNFMQREVNFQELEFSPGGIMHYNKY